MHLFKLSAIFPILKYDQILIIFIKSLQLKLIALVVRDILFAATTDETLILFRICCIWNHSLLECIKVKVIIECPWIVFLLLLGRLRWIFPISDKVVELYQQVAVIQMISSFQVALALS